MRLLYFEISDSAMKQTNLFFHIQCFDSITNTEECEGCTGLITPRCASTRLPKLGFSVRLATVKVNMPWVIRCDKLVTLRGHQTD